MKVPVPAEKPADGVVYFAAVKSGPIKIGYTTDLSARLARLQSNCPQRLSVIACFKGEKTDELELHQLFREQRLHGEWFRRSPELMSIVEFWRQRMPGLRP